MRTALALTFVLVQGCCSPDEKIEDPCGQACPPYLKCDNGFCVCEKGFINIEPFCIPVDDNTYYAKTDACYCLPEMLVKIPKELDTVQYFYNGYKINYAENYRDYGTFASYFPSADGDSVVLFDIIYPYCEVQGVTCAAMLAGKVRGDTLDAWIKWYPPVIFPNPLPKRIDSCHLYLIKPKV